MAAEHEGLEEARPPPCQRRSPPPDPEAPQEYEEGDEEEEEEELVDEGEAEEAEEEEEGDEAAAAAAALAARFGFSAFSRGPGGAAARSAAPAEWAGLKSFPAATQAALQPLLGSLKGAGLSELTVLLVGRAGAGKSSTCNSLLGERAAPVAAFGGSEAPQVLQLARTAAGFTLRLLDAPSLLDGDAPSPRALAALAAVMKGRKVDAVLYVDRLDSWRVDGCDRAAVAAVTATLGSDVWRRTAIALTHGQVYPPGSAVQDAGAYGAFVAKRHAALQAAIRATLPVGAPSPALPLVLVENSGRCATNEGGEKVLPDGSVWQVAAMERLAALATEGGAYSYDAAAVAASADPNLRHRWAILPLLALQWLVLRPLLVRQMKRDGEPGAKERAD